MGQHQLLREVLLQANAGVFLSEILDHIYVSLRTILPFDRMGLALLEGQGSFLRSHWVRSEASEVRLGPGLDAPMHGSSLQQIAAGQKRRTCGFDSTAKVWDAKSGAELLTLSEENRGGLSPCGEESLWQVLLRLSQLPSHYPVKVVCDRSLDLYLDGLERSQPDCRVTVGDNGQMIMLSGYSLLGPSEHT